MKLHGILLPVLFLLLITSLLLSTRLGSSGSISASEPESASPSQTALNQGADQSQAARGDAASASKAGALLASKLEMSETCILCHEDKAANLRGTAHTMPSQGKLGSPGLKVFCQDCHLNPEKHLEEPTAETARRTADMSAEELFGICAACHPSPHWKAFAQDDPHFGSEMTCASCHKVHRPNAPRLLLKQSSELCLDCHSGLAEVFSLPSHHRVRQGLLECVTCHSVLSSLDRPFARGTSRAMCVDCHTEYEGPFPYEHEAMNEYGIEGHGCLTCHESHGSVNQKLLKEPDGRLCLQCHPVPRHFTAHGGVWSRRPCQECHADVHGSYTNQKFFPEDIRSTTCFSSGCHSF